MTEQVGVTLPAMSRMIEGLVLSKLVVRKGHPVDRRRITLEIAPRGQALWETAFDLTQASFARKLSQLDGRQCATVGAAMRILFRLFAAESATDGRRAFQKEKT